MPHKFVSIDLQQLEKRAKDAKALKKLLTTIYTASFKGPSYTGKARDIDQIKKAEDIAQVLDFDLSADVAEAKERKALSTSFRSRQCSAGSNGWPGAIDRITRLEPVSKSK